MSELNLLIFGCLVSFIAVGGAYVYVRDGFTTEEKPSEPETVSSYPSRPTSMRPARR